MSEIVSCVEAQEHTGMVLLSVASAEEARCLLDTASVIVKKMKIVLE